MKARSSIALVGLVLLVVGLACETGEILTPEEATRRAEATLNPGGVEETAAEAQLEEGDSVQFVSSSFLVALHPEPGDPTAEAHIARGETGTVQGSEVYEGEIWYRVETDAGAGWVNAEFINRAAAEGEGDEGIQVGDRVYLTAQGFLINFMSEPGGNRIVAGQERGALVTVRAIEEVEGTTWYRVEASAGTGWVPEDNITTEQPSG